MQTATTHRLDCGSFVVNVSSQRGWIYTESSIPKDRDVKAFAAIASFSRLAVGLTRGATAQNAVAPLNCHLFQQVGVWLCETEIFISLQIRI